MRHQELPLNLPPGMGDPRLLPTYHAGYAEARQLLQMGRTPFGMPIDPQLMLTSVVGQQLLAAAQVQAQAQVQVRTPPFAPQLPMQPTAALPTNTSHARVEVDDVDAMVARLRVSFTFYCSLLLTFL